jgi:hypothetical protein
MTTPTLEQSVDDFLIAQPGEPIVNITPFTARQKVNSYIGYNISHMMGSEEPSLCYSRGRLVWRVPIILTSPFKGKLGVVGHLDVNARTGQIIVPPAFAEEIQANASKLITPFPSSSRE